MKHRRAKVVDGTGRNTHAPGETHQKKPMPGGTGVATRVESRRGRRGGANLLRRWLVRVNARQTRQPVGRGCRKGARMEEKSKI